MTERLRNAILEMWDHRYDVDPNGLVIPREADKHFPGPVVVDLGHLAVAYSEILTLTGTDEPLEEEEADPTVVNLDEHRIRTDGEFEGEAMAYVEALWGKETHSFNAAVRDLEAIRRGTEDPSKPLRPPETYHEAMHLVLHVRALANDLARHFGIDDLVREADDLKKTR